MAIDKTRAVKKEEPIKFDVQTAAYVMRALAVCDKYGEGPTTDETRALAEYIYAEHPDVFSQYVNTPTARDVLTRHEGEEAA